MILASSMNFGLIMVIVMIGYVSEIFWSWGDGCRWREVEEMKGIMVNIGWITRMIWKEYCGMEGPSNR